MAHSNNDHDFDGLATSDMAVATLDYWLASKCWRGKMAVGDTRGPDTMGELLDEAQRLAHRRKQLGISSAALLEEVIEGETGYDRFLKTQKRRTAVSAGITGKEVGFVIIDEGSNWPILS